MSFDDENNNVDNIPEVPVKKRRRPSRRKAAAQFVDGQVDGQDGEAIILEIPKIIPLLPLRDVVVFNYMIVPLFVGREQSVQAIEAAATQSRHIFLCTQKDMKVDEIDPDNLYKIGSVALILRLLKMPDGRVKALVQGISRARLLQIQENDKILEAKIEILDEEPVTAPLAEQEALVRLAKEHSERILAMRGIPAAEIMAIMGNVIDPGHLADLIAANLRLKMDEAQALLECLDPMERLRKIIAHLIYEAEITSMQMKIQATAREGMDKAQKEYFLREQLRAIRKELGDGADLNAELDEIGKALKEANLPPDVDKEATKQLKRLSTMHNDSAEAGIIRTYLDWLSELPWSKFSEDQLDIKAAKTILNEDHFGLDKVKERILEYLSVRKLNQNSKGPILCFAGPPGVGKTSLGKSIARALGRKFQRISLGGMRDEAEIRGHRRTYVGALPGRIIQAMKQAGTANPVIILDEIDKLGNDFKGDPSSALLEALDPEQNFNFSDHYLNVPFDLSKVLFLCTANHLENIPNALRDRLEIINITGYTQQEKLVIAKKYLVPKQEKENGLKPNDLQLMDATLQRIIQEYTREAGLRSLEREIGSVCRKLARRKAEGKNPPFKVNAKQLPKLLGIPRFLNDDLEKKLMPGVAIGLAWTPVGGEILHIEVSTIKGKGGLTLTGQLGDVMKESAQAALSYAKSKTQSLGLAADFAEHTDIHIHVPAGATPKDGPSAGVTMVTALLSALTVRSVKPDLCMTGEITLRGRILPVGGIKEKILAAVTRGLKDVIIPARNVKDLEDVPQDLLHKLNIHPVETIDEILPLVFE